MPGGDITDERSALDKRVDCYAKIAMQLNDKTVRDVALRCRWMEEEEASKRRKEESSHARKNKGKKKGRVVDPSAKPTHVAGQSSASPFPTPMIPMENNDGIPFGAIGGVAGDLLQQNAQALNQISANLASFKVQENIGLLSQTRNNLLKLMNELDDMPNIMEKMPPLPVKLNLDLANIILPPPPPQMPPLPVKLNLDLDNIILPPPPPPKKP
ncbi:hypothetical protein V6N13_040783 [Hibiscus sabdariffa]|uniref:Uncharacterized protein n=1 Tax=Hibiscus sabdariffa TaxID=183260 RepID=A0ABR2R9E1_9ROSI